MNKIVLRHYPADQLPQPLREQFHPNDRVTVEVTQEEPGHDRVMTLEEIFAARKPPYRTAEEIIAEIQAGRYDD
ncbi:hypothetical protein [Alsobacter soli]|nr:hypothetical protein [Alsobacter soli]